VQLIRKIQSSYSESPEPCQIAIPGQLCCICSTYSAPIAVTCSMVVNGWLLSDKQLISLYSNNNINIVRMQIANKPKSCLTGNLLSPVTLSTPAHTCCKSASAYPRNVCIYPRSVCTNSRNAPPQCYKISKKAQCRL